MLLDGRVVLITGGAGLLGLRFVEAIIREGGLVVVACRDVQKARQALQAFLPNSIHESRVAVEHVDITNTSSVACVFEKVIQTYGRLEAVVNNAFPKNSRFGRKFDDVEYHDVCENIGMHVGGYILTSQQALAFFYKQGFGNIINISSVYGVIPPRFELYTDTGMTKEVEYSVSKSAIIHLTKYLANYCKGKNIRVNCITPGGIYDGQDEKFVRRYNERCLNKGMLEGQDVAGALIFLLSDLSACVNGQNIVVDDGFVLS
ncbi:MAG: SDR family oxidoreductase [Magnetococcales bacterium]|nr:SDR family oxidoreductase [Desulfobacterales bacterium]MBF0117110.1 SDR family oxidoreductase [Magnetococcales bacterium]